MYSLMSGKDCTLNLKETSPHRISVPGASSEKRDVFLPFDVQYSVQKCTRDI